MNVLAQDLRFAIRMLRRNFMFSTFVVVCLALGIGANTVVFSWIEGLAMRPYPAVKHQERMVVLTGTVQGQVGAQEMSWPDFLDLQRDSRTAAWFIADKITGTTLNIGERAERVTGSIVSANYFDAIGVHPILGRGFESGADIGSRSHPEVVISYWLWREKFQSDPNIVGKVQLLNGVPHTIIGVAPKDFLGTFVGYPMQFWVPASMEEVFQSGGYKLNDRSARWIEGFVLLKPGVSLERAQAELWASAARLAAEYPATNRGANIQLMPLWKDPFNKSGELLPALRVAMAIVIAVLLIACANASNLFLVRSMARRHEMTVRVAIGASAARVVGQLLTEGLILSLVATVLATGFAYGLRNSLIWVYPSSFVRFNLEGHLDWRVLLVTAVVGIITTLLFAMMPALQSSKVDLAGSLKAESGGVVGGSRRAWLRATLVLVQVSFTFVLLVGVGLILKSMQRIATASPGFATDDVVTTDFDLISAGYDKVRAKHFQQELVERVRSLPGVESAALGKVQPFSYSPFFTGALEVEGYEPGLNERPTIDYNKVGPGYFATLEIPLLAGREFTAADDENSDEIAIVNQRFVDQYCHGADPLGKRVKLKDRWLRIVGVAQTSKYVSLTEAPKPFLYVPYLQDLAINVGLDIRTSRDASSMASTLAKEAHAIDPNVAPLEVITMRRHVNRSALALQQVVIALLGIFGGVALLMASIGLYGVMSYVVSQRTRELGLRIALGATRADLMRLVISNGLALIFLGVAVGAIATVAIVQRLGTLLYKTSPFDPTAYGLALLVMLASGVTACLFPALRALRNDPVQALRG